MLSNLGTGEIIIIAFLIVLFFGSKKLKELAKGLGEATKEAKKIGEEFNSKD